MAVFVRELRVGEGNELLRIARSSKSPIEVRRAQVVIASDQGMKAPAIAELYHLSPDYVRKIIHRYNAEGLVSIREAYSNGGRPPALTPEQRSMVVETASTPPKFLGMPFTHWSLRKLSDYLRDQKILPDTNHEQVRQVLKRAGWSLQRTKTWKESSDPEFIAKKNGSGRSTKRRRKTGG